jgi:predicted Zn-dependent protease
VRYRVWLLVSLWGVPLAPAQTSPLLDVLSAELARNFTALKQKADPAPYYLAYEVTDQRVVVIQASLGALMGRNASRGRVLDVTIRLGSPQLDNYHRVRGDRPFFTSGAALAVDSEAGAIGQRLWLETDRSYRAAAERLIKIRTNQQVKVAEEDTSADFSSAPPVNFEHAPDVARVDEARWTERIRALSARFRDYPAVLMSYVWLTVETDTRYLVNTEGTRLEHGRTYARVMLMGVAKADDGANLALSEIFDAADVARLPSDAAVRAAIDRVGKDLTALLRAPEVEPYVGPAIFSGRAAGVFFHEIFGHRVEGHRQKDEAEGQTFTKRVGLSVLPEFLSVVFDPTRRQAAGVDLNGFYEYDNEGVKAQPVKVVENGILKTFLMSRSPIRGVEHSNGHGRRQPGAEVVSRQSSLIVESARTVSDAALRALLVEEVRKRNKPYGLFFRDVTGGFTNTGRGGVQSFKVIPLVVYRVWADGRPDELVRGADIVGTPLASFEKILATGDRPEVFNGYCGAESGTVPVSAVAPAILVSEVEIEKQAKGQDRPPLLPAPGKGGGK